MSVIPEASERVKRLYAKTFESPMQKCNLSYDKSRRQGLLFAQGWLRHRGVYSARLRRAYAEAYVLENMRPSIDPDELILGKPDLSELTAVEQEELERIRVALPPQAGRRGHMTLDWEKLLRVGVRGLIEEIETRRAKLTLRDRDALSQDEFYEGALVELNALLRLARRYAEEARVMGLTEQAEILARVPEYPARTFREAVQSIHFYCFCLWDLYFFGRIDQYLLTYDQDISREDAQELIDCLMLLSAHYITPTSVQVLTVGGRTPTGELVDNRITRMALISAAHAPVQVAQIALIAERDTPEDIFDLSVELLSRGHAQPQIYNGETITRSMLAHGFPREASYDWANCGCVEIVPCAASAIFTVSPYLTLVKMLLEAMEAEPEDFECLMAGFRRIVRREVEAGNLAECRTQMERARNGNESLRVSCLVNDCLARGMSIDEGGARYNHIQPNFLGMANVADGLCAIRQLVYRDRELTMAEFRRALQQNWVGYERLREKIVNKLPHFGTNEAETDELMRRVTEILLDECRGLTGYRGREPLMPGAFSYLEHTRHGKRTGASPDGRYAGYPLAAGSGAVQGRETRGPTAALRSNLAWAQNEFLGGIANNLMFSKKQMTGERGEKLKALIEAFLCQGGMELQINVTDPETLRAAQKDPEAYRDLLVRVGGFNEYFVHCTPELQQEIIDRNAHVM